MTKHMSIALRNFLFSTVAAGLAALRSAAHFTTLSILTCKNLDNMESSRAKGSWVKPGEASGGGRTKTRPQMWCFSVAGSLRRDTGAPSLDRNMYNRIAVDDWDGDG